MNKLRETAAVRLLAAIAVVLLAACNGAPGHAGHAGADAHDETRRGPHGGWWFEDGDFAAELKIVEAGIPPEFRLYAYANGNPVPVDGITARVQTTRLGGDREEFTFVGEQDYLRGIGRVGEPHSFDIRLEVTSGGRSYDWQLANYEGRTVIPRRIADEAGLETEIAGPQTIVETLELTGTVQTNPGRVSQVRARFPGVVTRVVRDIGDTVRRGDALAYLETNQSLSSVALTAPIAGMLVDRNVQAGQVTGDAPLFVIADLSEVWVQLDVFGHGLAAIEAGQAVSVSSLDGASYTGTVDWVAPVVAHGSQSARARVALQNPDGALRPGQFVRALVTTARTPVPLAVRRSALQTFREWNVVYACVGDTYEVRMLDLGRKDDRYVEVIGGLTPGEAYVTANSYLVKADVEKSGASHDH